MNNTVLDEDRVIMIGNLGGLAASALVNSNVYKYSARFHLFEIFFLKDLRSSFSGDQYRTDYQVCFLYRFLNVGVVGNQCLHTRAKQVIQISQSWKADIQDRYVCSHTYRDLAGVGSYITAAQDYDVCLRGSRNTC